jgi:NADH-ubiquinone oxidoreductase chain 4
MLLLSLLTLPLIGAFIISTDSYTFLRANAIKSKYNNIKIQKIIALTITVINCFISFFIFILFDFSSNQFQFVQEPYSIKEYNFYLGLDGISIYFVLLTTIIMPITLISN